MSEVEMISALLGFMIGLTLAMTGAGGGTLAIPLLIVFLNLTITQAAPVALLAVFFASTIGAIQGLRKGLVRYKAAILIATFGMLIAPLGVKLAQHTPSQALSLILIATLVFISLQSWQKAKQEATDNSQQAPSACMINPATSKLFWTASCTKRLTITGLLSGFASGLLGVGGGFMIVPSLNKVSNFNDQTIVATTLTAVSLISISSITSHIQLSAVNWHIAIPFTISAILAMLVFSEMFSHQISSAVRQKSFALLCLVAALHLGAKNLSL